MDGPVVTNIEKVARAAQLAEDQLKEKVFDDINGVPYWRKSGERVVHRLPTRQAIEFSTLAGLCDYVIADPDKILDPTTAVMLLIKGPTKVLLVGAVRADDVHSRETYAVAEYAIAKPFKFGEYYDREAFNIALMSMFDQEQGDWSKVLAVASTVVDDTSIKVTDNGLTQQVVAAGGIVAQAYVDLPNPVQLAPYRSFPDVEQPLTKFVVRCKGGNGEPVKFALFEADGGEWASVASLRIHDLLKEKLTGVTAALVIAR